MNTTYQKHPIPSNTHKSNALTCSNICFRLCFTVGFLFWCFFFPFGKKKHLTVLHIPKSCFFAVCICPPHICAVTKESHPVLHLINFLQQFSCFRRSLVDHALGGLEKRPSFWRLCLTKIKQKSSKHCQKINDNQTSNISNVLISNVLISNVSGSKERAW